MKRNIFAIIFLFIFAKVWAQDSIQIYKSKRIYIGFNYLSAAKEQFYGLRHAKFDLNSVSSNAGIQLAYQNWEHMRLSFWYTCFDKEYANKAVPHTFFDNRKVKGNQWKIGVQWLIPLENYPWIKICLGVNGGFSNNKVSYQAILFEPTFKTTFAYPYNENIRLYAIEGQTGIAIVIKKTVEISLLPAFGWQKRSDLQNEVIYSFPQYGITIGSVYAVIQGSLGVRF